MDVDVIADLQHKVLTLSEENKRLKQRLKCLVEDSTGRNLQLFRNIVLNYYDDLDGDTPIVIDKGGYYKLGASVEEYSVKQLKEWGDECDELNGFEDNTKVLLIC